jgi:hypothetical protein
LSAADGHSCPSANEQRGWRKQSAMHGHSAAGQECPAAADKNVRSPHTGDF